MERSFSGHKRGRKFTGAVGRQRLFQAAAQRAPCFLDEVADLPWPAGENCCALSRKKSGAPTGHANKEEAVDVRLLLPTHKDLAAEVAAGRFRQGSVLPHQCH